MNVTRKRNGKVFTVYRGKPGNSKLNSYKNQAYNLVNSSVAHQRNRFNKYLAIRNRNYVLINKTNPNKLLGFATMKNTNGVNGLALIGTVPWRQGYGRMLMNVIRNNARKRGSHTVRVLSVAPSAQAFYRVLGYTPVNNHKYNWHRRVNNAK